VDDALTVDLTVVDPRARSAAGTRADVTVRAPSGTPIGELRGQLHAAVGVPDGELYVGDAQLPDDAPVGQPPLLHAAVLTVGRGTPREPGGLLELHVRAGPDSGAVHRLAPGEHAIGRGPDAVVRLDDPDVSRLHALLVVSTGPAPGTTVRDLGSTNGSKVDGVSVGPDGRTLRPGQELVVGQSRLVLTVPETLPVTVRPDGAGHLCVNRPPRLVARREPVRFTRPAPPPPREPRRLPLVAVLVPLLAGVALCVVTRSPTYLVFILLSPLMALGSYVSDRWGGRRSDRERRQRHDEEMARLESQVAAALTTEAAARTAEHPGPAELLLCAQGPRPRLWERRAGDADDLHLRVGVGAVTSDVEVRAAATGGDPQTVQRPALAAAPVTVDLQVAGVLGVCGPRPRALALTRSLLTQLAGWHSPRRLGIAVLVADGTGRADDWEWTRWLPHLTRAEGGLRVGLNDVSVGARLDELLTELAARLDGDATRAGWTGPVLVTLLDGAHLLRSIAGVSRLLEDGPAVGMYAICVEDERVSLPVECRAVAEVSGDVGAFVRLSTRADHGDRGDRDAGEVVVDGVSEIWARRFARALGPLRDATPDGPGARLPGAARLLDLLPADITDPDELAATWRAAPRGTAVILGVGTEGDPLVVDLARDGPHVLVAGTTGSGKSELLQTLIAGLAAANRPDELSFVLVDYKGGAAFRDCARLPHTVGLVTDLDSHLTQRALASLGAELRRRESLLRAAACADLEEYAAQSPDGAERLARLVLVVDEFATLAEELPDFVGGLVGLAQRGRSLGVHLVLATQRPAGVVSADIRANTGLRIALRVTDPAESTDVVDVRDAALLSRTCPGRAVVRVGTGAVRTVQTARIGGRRESAPRPTVLPSPWRSAGDPPPGPAEEPIDGPTDLARFVAAARTATTRLACRAVASPWLPPLPSVVTTGELAGLEARPTAVPLGVLDLPTEQRQPIVTFDLEDGEHLLLAGGPGSGRTTALRMLAAGLAARLPVHDLHLHALDGGGGLAPLAALPHLGTFAGREDPALGDRLLVRLTEELERRQGLLAAAGLGSHLEQRATAAPEDRLPWLVLLADGWEGLVTAFEVIDHGRPLDALLRLAREGASAGIRVVLTGDRSVLAGRAAASFRHRLVLPLADRADYGLAGIAARSVPPHLPPGRALVGPAAAEAQLAVLDRDPTGAAQVAAVARVAARCSAGARTGPVPLRLRPLPPVVGLADLAAAAKEVATGPSWTLVGAGGDEATPVGIDLDADGPALVVAGPPGSGRSTALLAIGTWLLSQGRELVVLAARPSPVRAIGSVPGVLAVLGAGDDVRLRDCLARHRHAVVLADDAETLHDAPVEAPLLDLLRADARSGPLGASALVLAGSTTELATRFRGVTVEARRSRTGVLLSPASAVDGDLFGVRVPPGSRQVPGRGLLVVRGRVTPVQVARPDR
jgi:DNA segregation ATPase FtsK/SpoIIIE, S-DNA-T family